MRVVSSNAPAASWVGGCHLAKAFPHTQSLFLDGVFLVGNEQFDEATLDDVNVGGFIPLLEHELALLDGADFQTTKNLVLLVVGDAAEYGNLREDRNHFFRIFEWDKRVHQTKLGVNLSGCPS